MVKATIEVYPQDEVFTHKDDDGTFRTFLTGAMARFAIKYPKAPGLRHAALPIQPYYVAHVRKNMGIEQDRLDRLAEPHLSIPLIGITWDDEKLTIVDGNHRLVKLHEVKRQVFHCHIFAPPLWSQFLLPYSRGEEALTQRSGVIEHEQRRQK